MHNVSELHKEAILRVGEVTGVNGRSVFVTVDKNKNSSDLIYDGDILKNISVNSLIEIKKGFLSIIGKVDAEKIEEDKDKSKRTLTISLIGCIKLDGKFIGGTKELPLIGNEAYIVTRDKAHIIHNLVGANELAINIATNDSGGFEMEFPIDNLFNSHIAIFGNTGSGKSNTLAILYQELIKKLEVYNVKNFKENFKFILFDFNGEYGEDGCICRSKKIFCLSTRHGKGERIPIRNEILLDVEMLAILSDATEKTQKPFLKRTISLYSKVNSSDDIEPFFKAIVKKCVENMLCMSDKIKAYLLIDYLRAILPEQNSLGEDEDLVDDIEWHNKSSGFKSRGSPDKFFSSFPAEIKNTIMYKRIDSLRISSDVIEAFIQCMYIQLIKDVLDNRAQNDHIIPVIHRLKSKQTSISKIINFSKDANIWESNFVVINMHDINLDMKKTLPLLLAKKLYADHKLENNSKALIIIIDEAHNILSKESFREAESWKDYRLETFEEIIKEGRKFGVFMTIASQRPNDISSTITSQAHNYFIHRLINQKDLEMISTAVSYIDRVTEESIPTLPVGTCIFSGVATQMPLKINVKPLVLKDSPAQQTRMSASPR